MKVSGRITCKSTDSSGNIRRSENTNDFLIWTSACFNGKDTTASTFVPYNKKVQITGTKEHKIVADSGTVLADDGTTVIFEPLDGSLEECPQMNGTSCTFSNDLPDEMMGNYKWKPEHYMSMINGPSYGVQVVSLESQKFIYH